MLIKKKIPKENKKVAFSDIKYSLLLHVCGDIRKPFHIYINTKYFEFTNKEFL